MATPPDTVKTSNSCDSTEIQVITLRYSHSTIYTISINCLLLSSNRRVSSRYICYLFLLIPSLSFSYCYYLFFYVYLFLFDSFIDLKYGLYIFSSTIAFIIFILSFPFPFVWPKSFRVTHISLISFYFDLFLPFIFPFSLLLFHKPCHLSRPMALSPHAEFSLPLLLLLPILSSSSHFPVFPYNSVFF